MPVLQSLWKGRRRSSSLLLAVSNFGNFALPLVRGIVLARLLEPAQFGLAITITLTASTIEMISDLGIGQMATRTGSAETLSTLHALTLLRGFMLSVIIAALGPVLATLFHAPGTAWIYSVVGAASFIRSFSHLEPRMRMRDYQYTPEALTNLGSQTAWTLTSIAAAFLLRDYRAMVIGIFVYASGTALITHWCSTTRYRLAWNREVVTDALQFGRPLTMNGIALAAVAMGDRFLVGARLGLEQLAQYTALATAAFSPRSVITSFAVSLFLPQFVNAAGEDEKRRLADGWVIFLAGLGGLFALAFIAGGQPVVAVAFGKHYLVDQTSVTLIAGLACIRFMSNIPVAPSMASGRTSFVLLTTVLAATGIVLAAILVTFVASLHTVIGALIVGEGFGLIVVLDRLRRIIPVTPLVLWTAVLVPGAMVSVVGVIVAILPDGGFLARAVLCGAGIVVQILCAASLLRYSGSDIAGFLHMLLPRRRSALQPAVDTP